jgi:hypothetical protein
MAADTLKVFNDDVAGIWSRLIRYMEELIKSQSANLTEFISFDLERLKSYLDDVTKYLDWIVAQPQLDLPETSPREIELETPPEVPKLENPMIVDCVRLIVRARDEIANSQSARRSSGLVTFDEKRLRAVIEKCAQYLDNYVATVSPIDLPESSPRALSSGSGRTGI